MEGERIHGLTAGDKFRPNQEKILVQLHGLQLQFGGDNHVVIKQRDGSQKNTALCQRLRRWVPILSMSRIVWRFYGSGLKHLWSIAENALNGSPKVRRCPPAHYRTLHLLAEFQSLPETVGALLHQFVAAADLDPLDSSSTIAVNISVARLNSAPASIAPLTRLRIGSVCSQYARRASSSRSPRCIDA